MVSNHVAILYQNNGLKVVKVRTLATLVKVYRIKAESRRKRIDIVGLGMEAVYLAGSNSHITSPWIAAT